MVVLEPIPSADVESKPSKSTTSGVESSSHDKSKASAVDRSSGGKSNGAGVDSSSGDNSNAAGFDSSSGGKSKAAGVDLRSGDESNGAGVDASSGDKSNVAGVDSRSGGKSNGSGVDSSGDNKATTAGYASDGYETASETEVGDYEAVSDNNGDTSNLNNAVELEHQEHGSEEVSVASKDQSYEDALNDEELKQKILSQMNEAKVEGNKLFGDGLYDEALSKYDYAIQLAPEMPASAEIRSICHNNRATCFFKLGKYQDTVKECTKALDLNPTYMKALLRRGEAHEKLENYDEAIADLKKIVELDPSNYQAKRTIIRLEPLAIEKREKMKEEMIGKLKEMGNSILGRFGMSVDNFKTVKDPNTGSYSISFQR